MGIFSNTACPFDGDVEKVTPEEDKGSEDWASILDICDKVGESSTNAKDCLKSIVRRLNHPSPHVVLKTITLLDACVNNCKKKFHLEVASRDFEQEFKKLLTKFQSTQPRLADKLKLSLKKWAENEFQKDPELSLIPELYAKLRQDGVEFPTNPENTPKSMSSLPKNPDAATSQKEIDDIAKAIEMSLKETSLSGQSSLYPSTSNMISVSSSRSQAQNTSSKQKVLVKALYDFEAVEDNELTFYTGEMIEVLDDSDKNWWKGANHRGEGLFPANFVTTDLSSSSSSANVESKSETVSKSKHRVHFNDSLGVHTTTNANREMIIINEQKIDRLLHLLHEANPTEDSADTEEMLDLEDEVNAMGPLIDNELEKVDRKHAQLTQLSSNLVDAFNLYHSLMREPFQTTLPLSDSQYGMSMPIHNLPHPQPMIYNNGMNGPYSMPTAIMSDQYPPGSPQGGMLDMNQPSSHHFVPINSVPVQSDNFHPPTLMASPNVPSQSYPQNVDPNLMPVHYGIPNQFSPQQIPPNFYHPVKQEPPTTGSVGLQNNNRM